MATQKRRVIYLSDEEWALLKAQATEHKTTISGVIRDMWKIAARVEPADEEETARIRKALSHPSPPMAYGTFRPVPKPSQRGK